MTVEPQKPIAPVPESHPWSVAMLETLLRRRAWALLFFGAALVTGLSGLVRQHPVYHCPLDAVTGVPCPGCGTSRALGFLLRGEFRAMATAHPFAPYVVLLGIMLAGAACLPEPWRTRWVRGWTVLEYKVRLHAIALIAFAVFGIIRLFWVLASR